MKIMNVNFARENSLSERNKKIIETIGILKLNNPGFTFELVSLRATMPDMSTEDLPGRDGDNELIAVCLFVTIEYKLKVTV